MANNSELSIDDLIKRIYKSYVDQINYHDRWLYERPSHMVKGERTEEEEQGKKKEKAKERRR